MQAFKFIIVGILIGLIATAAILFIASPPRGSQILLLATSTQPPITIQISGEVVRPGLLSLAPGSRIADAINQAGGTLPEADISTLNLAQKLSDGQHIYVPDINAPSGDKSSTALTVGVIDLNSASVVQLDGLPGIGLTKAEAIIAYRQKIGGFDKIEQILDVPGIGPAIFDQIKDKIIVAP